MASTQTDPIKKVLVVGANGTLGSVLLKTLVDDASFAVSVLQRPADKPPASFPGVETIRVPSDEPTVEDLAKACAGQDAVIASFQIHDVSHHLRLVEAAHRADVRRYIPADFGSCESTLPLANKYFRMYADKMLVQAKCDELVAQSAAAQKDGSSRRRRFSWTSIINGHFFDYGLEDRLLHFNLDTHVAQLLDGGNIRASMSTLAQVSRAVVRVLKLADQTANRTLYIQSFCPTQRDILASLEKATGTSWRTETLESESYLEQQKKLLDGGDWAGAYGIVFVLGMADSDWTKRDGFAMDLLGLQEEKLDDVVAAVVAKHKAKA